MTKRVEWRIRGDRAVMFLDVSSVSVAIVVRPNALHPDLFMWHSGTAGVGGFHSLAAAQADAVRWLRATIAEMAAACPEVE